MADRHFLNLTNGLEWWKEVENPSLIRIESTAIEHKDWWRILRDLDANFLMTVALGHRCHIYDCGTRRQTSKTISKGLPFIEEALLGFWEKKTKLTLLTEESRAVCRKLNYFRPYYQGKVDIVGHSKTTVHDGDKSFYASILAEFIGASHD